MNDVYPCSDDSFEWIRSVREELLSRDKSDWKSFVSDLIPKQFEAYAKVLHQIDARYETSTIP